MKALLFINAAGYCSMYQVAYIQAQQSNWVARLVWIKKWCSIRRTGCSQLWLAGLAAN